MAEGATVSANFRVPRLPEDVAVGLAKLERIKRGVLKKGTLARSKENNVLLVPEWVKRDPDLYRALKRKTYKSQASLDQWVAIAAAKRGLDAPGFTRKGGRVAFTDVRGFGSAPVKSDRRVTTAVRNLRQK
jgi:hypothetical protein